MISAMDEVNGTSGVCTVTCGRMLEYNEEQGSHVIPPAREPAGIRNIDVR